MKNEQRDLTEKKSSWIINNSSDVSVCSIAEYFLELYSPVHTCYTARVVHLFQWHDKRENKFVVYL